MARLSTFKGEAAFRTWVHRVAVNHLLDRKRSAVERFELTFSAFADDLHAGLAPVAPNAGPELDMLAREVKHGCTLAMLTCLDRPLRVVYILGEVFGVSSADGAWICGTTEAAYRKRLSRARAAIREFVAEYCGLVAPPRSLPLPQAGPGGHQPRQDRPHVGDQPSSAVIDAATAEMEALYDAAQLMRSVNDEAAPEAVAVRIRSLMRSSRYQIVGP